MRTGWERVMGLKPLSPMAGSGPIVLFSVCLAIGAFIRLILIQPHMNIFRLYNLTGIMSFFNNSRLKTSLDICCVPLTGVDCQEV